MTELVNEQQHIEVVPERELSMTVNGRACRVRCEDRHLLVEVLREQLRLKGTHAGCLNGDCGACTLEGVARGGELDPVQQAFWENDGFQCGFCLPGQIFATRWLLARDPDPADV